MACKCATESIESQERQHKKERGFDMRNRYPYNLVSGTTPSGMRSGHGNKEAETESACLHWEAKAVSITEKVLRLTERVDLALQVGESHFREFKSALDGPPDQKTPLHWKCVASKIADTLVGFANADGGELIVGVEDDGTVTGIDLPDRALHNLLRAPKERVHRDTPLPSPRAHYLEYHGKRILFFSVQKGTDYVYLTSDGRCLQRKDRDTVPVASEHIAFSRTESESREYDRHFVDGAEITDLDISLVTYVAEQISKGMSVEKCLQHLDLAEFDGTGFRLRRAALLLFANEPSKWHPRLQVRIIRINGTELKSGQEFNVIKDEEVTDNILSLIEVSWDMLRHHLTETRFSEDAVFRTQIIYPELACREALINAIAHRDYSQEGRGIEVHVYTDRLEVISPGGLLSSIKLSDLRDLKGVHQSRNSFVARVLRELGYMRELGEGIRRIYELMQANDLAEPELASDHGAFSITLHHRYIYPREVKIWVDGFSDFSLSRDEKTVVRLGYDGHVISPNEIWGAVGIVDTDYYRQLLESLRDRNILYRSVSRNGAFAIAKKKRITKKSVPQFSIRNPSEILTTKPDTSAPDEAEYAKVFVGNVPYLAGVSDLMDVFSQFGTVADVALPYNHETGRPRGFAFVEFDDLVSARDALDHSGKIELLGRHLYVQRYRGQFLRNSN
jgi:ATP-dependent DNA helicase RecG